jgi:RimJ/RimL family protein N-acetyltransferase
MVQLLVAEPIDVEASRPGDDAAIGIDGRPAGHECGHPLMLAIALPPTDARVGSVTLCETMNDAAQVHLWIDTEHRGRGFAQAALALTVELARRSEVRRLTAQADAENETARSILHDTGFVLSEPDDGGAATQYVREVAPITLLPKDTQRLRLRLFEHEDTADCLRLTNHPDVIRYSFGEPWSETDAARNVSEQMVKTGIGDGCTGLTVVIEHAGTNIGQIQLWSGSRQPRVAEISWTIDPAYGRRGFATEAVNAVLDLAFGHYGIHRVTAQMDARNEASEHLARRVGMTREALLRDEWWFNDEWTSTLVYAILSTDTRLRAAARR